MIRGRRRSVIFFTVFGICLVVLAVTLNVSWIILNWRRGVLAILGVIFFLYRLKEVALYVTLFAIGHSATLLFGVLGRVHVNPYIIDAIIGFSVVYKAFDN